MMDSSLALAPTPEQMADALLVRVRRKPKVSVSVLAERKPEPREADEVCHPRFFGARWWRAPEVDVTD